MQLMLVSLSHIPAQSNDMHMHKDTAPREIIELLNQELPRLKRLLENVGSNSHSIKSGMHAAGSAPALFQPGTTNKATTRQYPALRQDGAEESNSDPAQPHPTGLQQHPPSSFLPPPASSPSICPQWVQRTNNSLLRRKLDEVANSRPYKRQKNSIYSAPNSEDEGGSPGPMPQDLQAAGIRHWQAPLSKEHVDTSDLENDADLARVNPQHPNPTQVYENSDAFIMRPPISQHASPASSPQEKQEGAAAQEPVTRKRRTRRSGSPDLGNKAQRKRIKEAAKVVRDANGRPIPHLNRRDDINDEDTEPGNGYASTDAFLSSSALCACAIAQAIDRKNQAQRGPEPKVVVSHSKDWNVNSRAAETTTPETNLETTNKADSETANETAKNAANETTASKELRQLQMEPFTVNTTKAAALPQTPLSEEGGETHQPAVLSAQVMQFLTPLPETVIEIQPAMNATDIFEEEDIASIIDDITRHGNDTLPQAVTYATQGPNPAWGYSHTGFEGNDRLISQPSPETLSPVLPKPVDALLAAQRMVLFSQQNCYLGLTPSTSELPTAGQFLRDPKLSYDFWLPSTLDPTPVSRGALFLSQRPPEAIPPVQITYMANLFVRLGAMSLQMTAQVHLGEVDLHSWIESQVPVPENGAFIQHNPHEQETSRQAQISKAKERLKRELDSMVVGSKPTMQALNRRLRSGKRWHLLTKEFGLPESVEQFKRFARILPFVVSLD
ncbi:MAG: hypothetical protein M1829_001679 [Trizodia sp. TS-e1964]|nr:MAG: hypothetical protein M1829_001679 [Trizodia sp. TS-e1964]